MVNITKVFWKLNKYSGKIFQNIHREQLKSSNSVIKSVICLSTFVTAMKVPIPLRNNFLGTTSSYLFFSITWKVLFVGKTSFCNQKIFRFSYWSDIYKSVNLITRNIYKTTLYIPTKYWFLLSASLLEPSVTLFA